MDLGDYNPERESRWQRAGTQGPAYYGTPGSTLGDLGYQIAGDPRMVECAVQQTFEALVGRPVDLSDTEELLAHRAHFLESDLRLKGLMAEILRSDPYQGRGSRGVPHKVADPDLLSSALEDLTGFSFTVAGLDVIQHDTFGMRSLASAASATFGQGRSSEATPMSVLILERMAEAAAWRAVARAGAPDDATLLTRVPTRCPR